MKVACITNNIFSESMSTGCFEMGESSFYSGTAYQFPFIIDKNRDCPNLTRGNWVTSIHQQNDSNNSPLYTRRTFGSTPESFGSTCGHGSTQAIDSTYTLDSAHIFCSPNNGNSIRKTITDVNSNNVNYKVPKLQLFVPLPPLQTVVSDDLFCITQPYPRNIPPTDIEPYQYTDAVFPRARISEQLYIPFPGEYEEEKEQHERVKEWEHVEILSNSRNFKRQPIINDHARMKPFVNKTRKHRTSPKSKSCEKCGSSETPEWRSGPIGRGT